MKSKDKVYVFLVLLCHYDILVKVHWNCMKSLHTLLITVTSIATSYRDEHRTRIDTCKSNLLLPVIAT